MHSSPRREIATELSFARGDHVEVRPWHEIRATLDADGALDGLVFMPEMLGCCGKVFRVARRADKTCVEGYGLRRMRRTVFLEGLRCDGAKHGGCQRNCQFFWKEAWLRPLESGQPVHRDGRVEAEAHDAALPTKIGDRYVCQSTSLAAASERMSQVDILHLVREVRRGDLDVIGFVRIVMRFLINRVLSALGWNLLDVLSGTEKRNSRGNLDLKAGELVEVLSAEEIKRTLDPKGRNCGLSFEPDMLRYVGQRFRVERQVTRLIREETGEMVDIARTVALEGVFCKGVCAKNCPRANPHFWREAWLKRVT